jgi:hypothetical protein
MTRLRELRPGFVPPESSGSPGRGRLFEHRPREGRGDFGRPRILGGTESPRLDRSHVFRRPAQSRDAEGVKSPHYDDKYNAVVASAAATVQGSQSSVPNTAKHLRIAYGLRRPVSGLRGIRPF